MKIAIIGSRKLKIEISEIIKDLNKIDKKITAIVSGGAIGVDTQAKKTAEKLNLKYIEYKPEYEKYGKIAPLKRNEQIINECEYVLAYWNGSSRGTMHAVNYAASKNKKITLINKKYVGTLF